MKFDLKDITPYEMEVIEESTRKYRLELIEDLLAVKDYTKRIGIAPCCARKAKGESCVCWQDRW